MHFLSVAYSCFICIFLGPTSVETLQLSIGDCPVFYEEPCQVDFVRFYLSAYSTYRRTLHLLNPFYPKLPPHYNNTIPLKILVHGYGGLVIDVAIGNVTKAYEEYGYNVIVVDWSMLSFLPCYATTFLNTWHVGQCIAILAVSLVRFGVTPDLLHVVGFSLGAHVAGFASNHLKKLLGVPFRRITGLDPALPFFATLRDEWKLDKSDADFVDVIHTSAGSFGKIEPAGDVDFYLNGGYLQPACINASYPPLCSHAMAGMYFAESVVNKNFIGVRCENLAFFYLGFCRNSLLTVMGEHIDPETRGIYFIQTSDAPPFGLDDTFFK